MKFEEIWERAKNIEGWLDKDEAQLLHAMASGTWCEVGAFKGKSTVVLADRHHGYVVDHFNGIPGISGKTFRDFTKNTDGLDITVFRKRFDEAVDKIPKVQLLFLDADHSYEATKLAFELYGPKVEVGGYCVLHDVAAYGMDPWPGVTKFFNELSDPDWKKERVVARCAVLKKLS